MTEGDSIIYLRGFFVPRRHLLLYRVQSSIIILGSDATTGKLRSLRQLKLYILGINICCPPLVSWFRATIVEIATLGAKDSPSVEDQQKPKRVFSMTCRIRSTSPNSSPFPLFGFGQRYERSKNVSILSFACPLTHYSPWFHQSVRLCMAGLETNPRISLNLLPTAGQPCSIPTSSTPPTISHQISELPQPGQDLCIPVRNFCSRTESFRSNHGSTNSTRVSGHQPSPFNISHLSTSSRSTPEDGQLWSSQTCQQTTLQTLPSHLVLFRML